MEPPVETVDAQPIPMQREPRQVPVIEYRTTTGTALRPRERAAATALKASAEAKAHPALEAIWALHQMGEYDEDTALQSLLHPEPMVRAWDSLAIILGVVPLETRAWKPEIAPHMMVMKRKGKTLPGTVGPPERNIPCTAGASSFGLAMIVPPTRRAIVPIFKKLER